MYFQTLNEAFDSPAYALTHDPKSNTMDQVWYFKESPNGHEYKIHFEKQTGLGKKVFRVMLGQKATTVKTFKKIFSGKFDHPLQVISTILKAHEEFDAQGLLHQGYAIGIPVDHFGAQAAMFKRIIQRKLKQYHVEDFSAQPPNAKDDGLTYFYLTKKPYTFDQVFDGKWVADMKAAQAASIAPAPVAATTPPAAPAPASTAASTASKVAPSVAAAVAKVGGFNEQVYRELVAVSSVAEAKDVLKRNGCARSKLDVKAMLDATFLDRKKIGQFSCPQDGAGWSEAMLWLLDERTHAEKVGFKLLAYRAFVVGSDRLPSITKMEELKTKKFSFAPFTQSKVANYNFGWADFRKMIESLVDNKLLSLARQVVSIDGITGAGNMFKAFQLQIQSCISPIELFDITTSPWMSSNGFQSYGYYSSFAWGVDPSNYLKPAAGHIVEDLKPMVCYKICGIASAGASTPTYPYSLTHQLLNHFNIASTQISGKNQYGSTIKMSSVQKVDLEVVPELWEFMKPAAQDTKWANMAAIKIEDKSDINVLWSDLMVYAGSNSNALRSEAYVIIGDLIKAGYTFKDFSDIPNRFGGKKVDFITMVNWLNAFGDMSPNVVTGATLDLIDYTGELSEYFEHVINWLFETAKDPSAKMSMLNGLLETGKLTSDYTRFVFDLFDGKDCPSAVGIYTTARQMKKIFEACYVEPNEASEWMMTAYTNTKNIDFMNLFMAMTDFFVQNGKYEGVKIFGEVAKGFTDGTFASYGLYYDGQWIHSGFISDEDTLIKALSSRRYLIANDLIVSKFISDKKKKELLFQRMGIDGTTMDPAKAQHTMASIVDNFLSDRQRFQTADAFHKEIYRLAPDMIKSDLLGPIPVPNGDITLSTIKQFLVAGRKGELNKLIESSPMSSLRPLSSIVVQEAYSSQRIIDCLHESLSKKAKLKILGSAGLGQKADTYLSQDEFDTQQKYAAMAFVDLAGDSAEGGAIYDQCDAAFQRKVAKYSLDGDFLSKATQLLTGDDVPIKPIENMTQQRIKEILKYNNIKVNATVVTKAPSWQDLQARVKANKAIPPIADLQIEEEPKTEKELRRMTVEYDKFNKRRHGHLGVKINRVFRVNIPLQETGHAAFLKENPGTTIISPAFHGTGPTAASMILRNGFRVLAPGSKGVVGRMLGDGIYFSNVLDKVGQYVSDAGYSRGIGHKGYIFEMDAALGKKKVNYDSAGVDPNDRSVISPEWCVFDGNRQLKIRKAYLVDIVDVSDIDKMRTIVESEDPTYESDKITLLESFMKRAKAGSSKKGATTYIFMDGNIPVSKTQKVDFEQYHTDHMDGVRLEISAHGPMVIIDTDETETFAVDATMDFMHRPDRIDKFLSLTKKS